MSKQSSPQSDEMAFAARLGRAPWWWVSSLVALTVFYLASNTFLLPVIYKLGDGPRWLDSHAILAAIDAHNAGLDVFQANPYDVDERCHSYSSLWLYPAALGFTRADNYLVGPLFVLFALVPTLFCLRPRNIKECGWLCLFFLSQPVILAIYRANNDLIVAGLLIWVAPLLRRSNFVFRIVGLFLVSLAFGLKYYPIVAAAVLLCEVNKRRFTENAVVLLMMLVGMFILVFPDLRHIASTQPNPNQYLGFGASLLWGLAGIEGMGAKWLSIFVGGAFLLLGTWAGYRHRVVSPALSTSWRFLTFIMGASLLAGCYWVGPSWNYRLIFLALIAPFLFDYNRYNDLPTTYQISLLWLRRSVSIILSLFILFLAIQALWYWSIHMPAVASLWNIYAWLAQGSHLVFAALCTLAVGVLLGQRLHEFLSNSPKESSSDSVPYTSTPPSRNAS